MIVSEKRYLSLVEVGELNQAFSFSFKSAYVQFILLFQDLIEE